MKKILTALLALAAMFSVGSGSAAAPAAMFSAGSGSAAAPAAALAVGGSPADTIPASVMQAIYDEVRTPYKYGLVVAPTDNYHKFDCPTVWREGDKWLMTYVCYDGKDGTDGRGYETWLAESDDLLHWTTLGRVLSLPPTPSHGGGAWDANQRGGFPALIDWTWGGSYEQRTYKGRRWMTYIGGHGTGYEAVREPLNIGLAWTKKDAATAHEWQTSDKPLLSITDTDAQWWESLTEYKSTVYEITDPTPSPSPTREGRRGGHSAARSTTDDSADRPSAASPLPCRGGAGGGVCNSLPAELATSRFLMFYNAGGINPTNGLKAERIGIALSNDMKHWRRFPANPVFANEVSGIITGDAQIVRMDDLFVMFHFRAYDPSRHYAAFNTFAASRDLVHWQTWDGPDLISPSKPYDELFAHKSCVVKHDGVVYHFYCAVNNAQQRGIAVATSRRMGRSDVRFPEPEPVGKRRLMSLNDGWTALCVGRDSIAAHVNLPHNFDDYYGYRQLRHGNLHGSAIYNKMFACEKRPDRRYFLEFQGVGTYATVTLNGREYPRELVGRTVWTLDVTDALLDGQNDLRVLVDHPAMQTASPWVCGGCSSEYGFSEGSQPFGIFRPVTLVETAPLRIEPFGVHIWANAACDTVFIETEVHNYARDPQTAELVSKFAQADGKAVFRFSQGLRVEAGETVVIRQSAPVANAHRWTLDDPYLYTLTSMLKQPEAHDPDDNPYREPALVTTDDVRTPFGLRSLSWPLRAGSGSVATTAVVPEASASGDNRFRLNGQPVFINGTCEYEHLLGQSHAFTPDQIRSRVKQIRNAGFNAFREAHQPHNLLYQQLFDEQGMLFWSQFSAHIWYDTPEFRANFLRLLERWVRERRNSPSVILWGLQNESVLPRDFAEECTALICRLDPTASVQRLITTCNGGEGTDWNVIQNWSGTYGGSAEAYADELSRPDQLLNGEYGAWRTLDLHGPAKYSEESFTALLALKDSLAQVAFTADTASLGVCGHFQWLFSSHDNPGRVQPDGALRRIDRVGPVNYKGLTTIWEEPTQAYYMYRRRHAAMVPEASASGTTRRHPAAPVRPAPSVAPGVSPVSFRAGGGSVAATPGYHYLYRINCGGDAYRDSQGHLWQADDSTLSHSWAQDFPGIPAYQASQRHLAVPIHATADAPLFQSFRFGRHRLWYDLPLPYVATQSQQTEPYRIELYFLEPWHGKDDTREDADYEGLRIFDVAVNDSVVIDDLDPWAEAGYCGAFRRVVYAPAKDGRLLISFPEVKAGQAVIAAIAVASLTLVPSPREREVDGTSAFWHSLDTDTIAKLPKTELPQDTEPRPATIYEPVSTKVSVTNWTVTPGLGQEYALRFRYKNTTGNAVRGRLTLTDSKNIVLVDRELSFPPTPDKFKMLSTTTGTQINAGTYRLTVEAEGVEFKNVEMQ